MSMENTRNERFSSASSDDTECYLYPKRIKIQSSQKITEKEEQQKLEESICCADRCQTSPCEPTYLSERQNWAIEKQSCDTERKTYMRDVFHFQTCSNERLPCKVSENKLSIKKWSPENGDQTTTEDVMSQNVHRQPLKRESLSVWSASNTCENLQVLNPPQLQPNNNTEQNNKRNDRELKQNSSVTSLNGDFFHRELSHKSVSDKKQKQHLLFQIPFLCGTSSVFSHTEHKKHNFQKSCSTENKNYSSSDNETTAEGDKKEKKPSSYTIPTLKPFKSIQPLKIPNFLLPSISNKINSKMLSTNLEEVDWKNFESQPSLMQSKCIQGVQKLPQIGTQKLQNESSIKASIVGSEFKENNYPSISKQEHRAWAEGGKGSVTYFRGNSTDAECNQIFAENYLKDEMLQDSDADDVQESKIHIYISAKNIQCKKCVSCNDLLMRMGKKSSNENMGMCNTQTSIPVIPGPLEKKKLDIHCGVHNSNSDSSLYETESKRSTKEILDFKRYLTKDIIFERHCPCLIVQNFAGKKVSCSTFRGKEMFKLKFSLQNVLFGWVRTWTESFYEDTPSCQDDSVARWFNFCETLNEQHDAQELVKSNMNRNHPCKICVCLLAVILKHLKVELQSTILPSFSSGKNAFLPTEGKSMQVEKHFLCGRKQDQMCKIRSKINLCMDNTLRQTTEFNKKGENCPGFLSSKFVENTFFELHNGSQRSYCSTSLGEEQSTSLERGTLFHYQKSGLCKGRHVRKHYLLSRRSEGFSTCLKSVSHKNSMKKQLLVAKCLILLQDTFDCSLLDKMYCCNVTKIQYLIGANLRFWSYLPGHTQFERVNSKCTNQETSVATVKQEKNKQSKMFTSSFCIGRLKALPFVLCENKKHERNRCRNCITVTNEVTNEVTYAMTKHVSTYRNGVKKECVNSKELQINSHNFLPKKSFSIFDTYEKIPLSTDSEDFDQIPVANQNNSVKKKLSEENEVTNSKEVHHLLAKSNDVLILPEPSKTTMEKCDSLMLQDSQTNKPEYCKKIGTSSSHLANKKVEDQNTYLNFESFFPNSSDTFQPVILPLDSSSFAKKDSVLSEDGHCRSSSSAENQKQNEKVNASVECPPTGSPAVTETHLQLQGRETGWFSLQGHSQEHKAASLEPATLKQHLEYVEEQEEINDEQMDVTNESQCEAGMNDLIMSYSEDESKAFIAAEDKLKMHLSIMNNGCLEDVKDKYLPFENKITYKFELKREFGLVLEELHTFHEISKGNENNLSSLETNSQNYCELNNSEGRDENLTSVSQNKLSISSPISGTIEKQNIIDSNESSLNEKISNENEDQKVSKENGISRLSSEEQRHSPIEEGYFDVACKKPYTWNPAFLSCTLFKEENCNLQEQRGYFVLQDVIRVQPLKTCKGPIRIGLSRKARPKQLHPYLK